MADQPANMRPLGRRQFLRLAGGIGALSLLAGACSARSETYSIDIDDAGRFLPSSLSVPLGATVLWYNRGTQLQVVVCDPHKARISSLVRLPANAAPWSSSQLYPGQTWSYVFSVPGSFVFTSNGDSSDNAVGTITVVRS